ncbi:TPR domain protein [Macrophomina phaseolina MS6]|uniref:TPR domain protein n=1 Tax=Macrophomina phaseolina (strain MS6) TaxID=1126212 RepID=K2SQQ8_MACPH|nr:TPR domain protein [Macrophomina phaseolina MS6]
MSTKETWTGFTNAIDQANATASSLEQALIHAIGVSFPRSVSEQDYASYNEAYVKAMEPIYQSHSEDLDVVTLYADALINLAPKHLWNRKTGELNAYARTLDTKEVFEQTFKPHPYTLRHPGLIHMYIHLMETSPTPEAALPAANHLRNMVPDAGHLNHMPSHLDCLVGDYWPPSPPTRPPRSPTRKIPPRIARQRPGLLHLPPRTQPPQPDLRRHEGRPI